MYLIQERLGNSQMKDEQAQPGQINKHMNKHDPRQKQAWMSEDDGGSSTTCPNGHDSGGSTSSTSTSTTSGNSSSGNGIRIAVGQSQEQQWGWDQR